MVIICDFINNTIQILLRSLMSSAETSDARISELERVEFSLRNQLREWEDKYMSLRRQNVSAMEKSCELEEVRNSQMSCHIFELVFSVKVQVGPSDRRVIE